MTLTKTQKEIIRLMREGAWIYRFPHTDNIIINFSEWTRANKVHSQTFASLIGKGIIEQRGHGLGEFTLTEKGRTVNID